MGKDISCELDVNREVNAVYVVKLLIFQCFLWSIGRRSFEQLQSAASFRASIWYDVKAECSECNCCSRLLKLSLKKPQPMKLLVLKQAHSCRERSLHNGMFCVKDFGYNSLH